MIKSRMHPSPKVVIQEEKFSAHWLFNRNSYEEIHSAFFVILPKKLHWKQYMTFCFFFILCSHIKHFIQLRQKEHWRNSINYSPKYHRHERIAGEKMQLVIFGWQCSKRENLGFFLSYWLYVISVIVCTSSYKKQSPNSKHPIQYMELLIVLGNKVLIQYWQSKWFLRM